MFNPTCDLCTTLGGALIFQSKKFRVIRAEEVGFPAFYRVVWSEHVVEFSDLNVKDRVLCMAAVNAVEVGLRAQLRPTKINLAALGNVVPHLHWHVIARFEWDSHFPSPVWVEAKRPYDAVQQKAVFAKLRLAEQDMVVRLAALT
jgi:diadenosine tetraphosphate (Ap4A) HIT family hydrolase